MSFERIVEILGDEAESLLSHTCETFTADQIHAPGPDLVDRLIAPTDRSTRVAVNLQRILDHGRLGGTGFTSILPVDQGIEHTAGASFGPAPWMFDPESIITLAINGGCSAVATTYGSLASLARTYAHKIPFILKLNHNELLTYPATYDQVPFASVQQAFDLGCAAVGATIYFGSDESSRQIQEVSEMFAEAHELGMATILWCYTRNGAFKKDGTDYHTAADLTSQAIHLGATIGADIVKQKLPTNNGGFKAVGFGKTHPSMYGELCTDNPIDMVRYQVANSYMGRVPVINSGGASGDNDLRDAVRTAVINKRGGGMGLILGRKAFQKPTAQGIEILNLVQDVYLADEITVA